MSKAHEMAVKRYNAANYEKITLRLRKEDAEALRSHIGKDRSINGFINAAIAEKIDREKLQ